MEVSINGISCVGTVEECQKFINNIMNSCQTTEINQSEEYVDLGLPSGKKWAKCNIGANKETESGLYFMWGDVVGRTNVELKNKPCNWNTVPFGKDIEKIKDMVCPNGVLAKEYDAAYIHTHGKAHMPTKEDFEELEENTNSSWETNFNGSGVQGMKFTSKKDPNKYIFIPASGYVDNDSLSAKDNFGYVRSSSLYSSNLSYAWFLYFCYDINVSYSCRDYGQSVRGVISNN